MPIIGSTETAKRVVYGRTAVESVAVDIAFRTAVCVILPNAVISLLFAKKQESLGIVRGIAGRYLTKNNGKAA